MLTHKKLVFIGAHPDDETFSVGATLAQYAEMGVKVYYVCATRGDVGQAKIKNLKGFSSLSDLREAELHCAAKELGITEVIHLNFRDSGMVGWDENKHPEALISIPLENVIKSIITVIRSIKPDVVITFDPIGGYLHPDHIVVHKATVKAFYAAGDNKQFPDAGEAYTPQKLYFNVYPRSILRLIVKFLSFLRINMKRVGFKRKVNLADMVKTKYPIHAVIPLSKKSIQARKAAALCHESMIDGKTPYQGINGLLIKLFGQRDYFMRAYPPVKSRSKEHDLFENL